ncbi:MAG: ERAP1-like C-terminal domain-containing protein, partial [Mixta calida]|nr:ERAP1-like C-terminal domain-containing protein [Mixta calida]
EDKLASGQNSAWRAGAAIPTKDVKTAVWKELTDTSRSMSNLERRHKLEGLTFAGSAPLLEPFAKDYFALAPRMWKNFSSETALQMVEGLFPYYATSQETVDTAQVVLDSEHPAALHRVIAEGQDRLQRALRNREADK